MRVEHLASLLKYNPQTGALQWLVSRGKARAGDVVTVADDRGYVVVGVDKKRYYAHRLAWMLMTGSEPTGVVDHIDGDRGNNRWSNLRDVPIKLNAQNRHVPSKRSRTQVLGVRAFGGKYRAALSLNGKQAHLGTFETVALAQAAYLEAKRQFHEGCTL